MSRISSGIATSGSSLTSWRMRSIGKSGERSSGPTGSPVPGCSTGCGGLGMSARMLYQRRGSSDSASRNFVCSTVARIPLVSGRGALEPLLQVLVVLGKLLPRLPPYERQVQIAEPMALEVELERETRARTVTDRLDSALPAGPDRAVDAAEGEPPRRAVLRHLGGHRPLAPTDSARHRRLRAHAHGLVALDGRPHDALLPLGETRQVGHVCEHVFRTPGNLHAVHDRCHGASSRRYEPRSFRTVRPS